MLATHDIVKLERFSNEEDRLWISSVIRNFDSRAGISYSELELRIGTLWPRGCSGAAVEFAVVWRIPGNHSFNPFLVARSNEYSISRYLCFGWSEWTLQIFSCFQNFWYDSQFQMLILDKFIPPFQKIFNIPRCRIEILRTRRTENKNLFSEYAMQLQDTRSKLRSLT